MSDAFVACSNLSFSWPDDTPVLSDLSFTVTTGRTGPVAPNGAGKSTLLKLIAGELRPRTGSLSVDGTLGYLPQSLPLAGDLVVSEVLGVDAVIRALDAVESATLACVLCAEPVPHLLLLDEPTNNLDLAGAGQLESALNSYQGAFMVISHDERFLAEIGVNRRLRLADGTLTETGVPEV